jgi:hypothetical protein
MSVAGLWERYPTALQTMLTDYRRVRVQCGVAK